MGLELFDLAPQSPRRPALADDDDNCAKDGDKEGPEHWILYVTRHKTLFRRPTARCRFRQLRADRRTVRTGYDARMSPVAGDATLHPSAAP
ncbi:hypothetical protein GCM10010272_23950 [Streptomyces lateritius]|nr:hypothetical protein GCM10010272_23950 [Streptomyces lateritius]